MTVPLCQAEPTMEGLCLRLTEDMPEIQCPCMRRENTAESHEGNGLASDLSQRRDESPMAFAIRIIQADAWDRGHQDGNDDHYYEGFTPNPYRNSDAEEAQYWRCSKWRERS